VFFFRGNHCLTRIDLAMDCIDLSKLSLEDHDSYIDRLLENDDLIGLTSRVQALLRVPETPQPHTTPKDEQVKLMLDRISEIELRVTNDGERVLNSKLMEEFLRIDSNRFSEWNKVREVLIKIERSTKYIPFSILMKTLSTHFAQFQENVKDRPFYLYLPSELKSTLLFTGHFWPQIQNMNLKGFIYEHCKVKDGMEILMIDDCIYTGVSLLEKIDEMSVDREIGSYPTSGVFHLVIGYANASVVNNIPMYAQSFNKDFKLYCDQYVQEIDFCDAERELITKHMADEAWGPIPIYFDHKIAEHSSTYTSVYIHQGTDPDVYMTTYPPDDIKNLIRTNELVESYLANFALK
jgi:hypothetical protein